MELKLSNAQICSFFTVLTLLSVSTISFALLGMMIQATPSLTEKEITMPEVYRTAEGLICLDAIIALYCILYMSLLCKPHSGLLSIFQLFLGVVAIGRFIMCVIFLAGNDEYLRDVVTDYDDLSEAERGALNIDIRNQNVTIKSAWVFEIIAVVFSACLSIGLIISQHKIKPPANGHSQLQAH